MWSSEYLDYISNRTGDDKQKSALAEQIPNHSDKFNKKKPSINNQLVKRYNFGNAFNYAFYDLLIMSDKNKLCNTEKYVDLTHFVPSHWKGDTV